MRKRGGREWKWRTLSPLKCSVLLLYQARGQPLSLPSCSWSVNTDALWRWLRGQMESKGILWNSLIAWDLEQGVCQPGAGGPGSPGGIEKLLLNSSSSTSARKAGSPGPSQRYRGKPRRNLENPYNIPWHRCLNPDHTITSTREPKQQINKIESSLTPRDSDAIVLKQATMVIYRKPDQAIIMHSPPTEVYQTYLQEFLRDIASSELTKQK